MSWAPEVLVDGKWSRNQLRFATEAEALVNAQDLFMRWTMADGARASEAADPVNYRYVEGRLIDFNQAETTDANV